jgi:hypothetical protein
MNSNSIGFLPVTQFHFSLCLSNTPWYIHILYFLYPVIGWWITQMISQFSYCEQSFNSHVHATILLYWFIVLQIHAWKWYGRSYAIPTFSFLQNLYTDFHSGCTVNIYTRSMRFPFSLNPNQHFWFFYSFLNNCQSDWSDMTLV